MMWVAPVREVATVVREENVRPTDNRQGEEIHEYMERTHPRNAGGTSQARTRIESRILVTIWLQRYCYRDEQVIWQEWKMGQRCSSACVCA